jgi:Cu2+-exporting ATPase
MFAAAAMSLSSFCVISNALRLNLVKIYDTRRDRPLRKRKSSGNGEKTTTDVNDESGKTTTHINAELGISKNNENFKEEKEMTKTMKIEGMMCGHCEARVKKALEGLDAVTSAEVSHEAGTAVVTLNAELDAEVLKKTVEEQDYKVVSIE